MSKNTLEIPYTELVERLREMGRVDAENDRGRARGAINHAYTRVVPREEDWSFLIASSSIVCSPSYDTGYATVTTGGTSVSFSGATLTTAMTGARIKFDSNADVYDFTYVSSSDGTISPALSQGENITSGAYTIFFPYYALASDFDRFLKDKGLERWTGGRPNDVKCVPDHTFKKEYSSTPGTPDVCRLIERGTDNLQYVELSPPTQKAIVLRYEYIKKVNPLRETTAGTVTVGANDTAVTGTATRFSEAQVGWFLRVDENGTGEDSEWYRVIAITHDSALTLQSTFGLVAATTAQYTLCAAPDFPPKLHDAVLFGGLRLVVTDQNDKSAINYEAEFRRGITDAKRLYKTRAYNQEVESALEDYNFRR